MGLVKKQLRVAGARGQRVQAKAPGGFDDQEAP